MDRKRVLFIAPQPFFEVRGTPIAVKDMLDILATDFDIDLVTFAQGKDLKIKNVSHYRSWSLGYKSVKIGFSPRKLLLDLFLFLTATMLVSKHKYEYIHCVEEAALYGVFLKKITRAKLVYDMDSIMSEQVSNSKFKGLKFIFEYIEKIIIKNSDLILAVSSNFKNYCVSIKTDCNFVEIFDVPQIKKIDVPEDVRNQFLGVSSRKVLYIGNGEAYQGIGLLEDVSRILKDVTFYIVGTGRSEIVENRVYISDIEMQYVWGVMRLVDVLVSPRLNGNNTPMKIYTYLAGGKPIVLTDIAAHNFLKDVAYVSKADAESFSAQISKALQNGEVSSEKSAELVNKFSFFNLAKVVTTAYKAI